jgi:hypothetical protein
MQFESVVTNSRLGFSDIVFLELSPDVASLLQLTTAGGRDWRTLLDDLGNVGHNFTLENLKTDIRQLYDMGVGLATSGGENMMERVLGGSSFGDLLSGNISSIAATVESSSTLWKELDKSTGATLLSILGGADNVSRLFSLSNYSLTSWMSDYLKAQAGQYYTQRWRIYRNDSGCEEVCNYEPPTDTESVMEGDEWIRYDASDCGEMPSLEQAEVIMSNSEKYAGWSRALIKQLNAAGDGYKYMFSYVLQTYTYTNKGKPKQRAFAYSISVLKEWNLSEEVYEELFDSYTMDLDGFRAKMNALLEEYNDNEDGYVYTIGTDDKNYYQTTSETKVRGCESAIISVTCSDGSTLMEGNTQYKCSKCGSSLDAHSKECAMQTTLSDSDGDEDATAMLDSLEEEYKKQYAYARMKFDQLGATSAMTQSKINQATGSEKEELQARYDAIQEERAKTYAEINELQEKLDEIKEIRAEIEEDEDDDQTDDYYRIPAIMQECKDALSLTWDGDGYWDGYTYIRKARNENLKGTITFQATLSIARKPKYFLGIKIHRAKLGIAWKLTAEYSDTQVVDVIMFDDSKSDAEKADEVNTRLSEIAQEYPDCELTTEYMKNEAVEEDASTDTYHLLWSSDRLEIAREIDNRLTQIYADLVSLEKMMSYKLSIVDVLKEIAPHINDTQGKKNTITEEAHERWMNQAKGLGKLH